MFYFYEVHFLSVGLFDWGYTRTQFLVSQNWGGLALAGYQIELPILPYFYFINNNFNYTGF